MSHSDTIKCNIRSVCGIGNITQKARKEKKSQIFCWILQEEMTRHPGRHFCSCHVCWTCLCYVMRGIWKSGLSKSRGRLTGEGSFSALCRSLNSPVPMFMGIPMMMHSDTPERHLNVKIPDKLESKETCPDRDETYHRRSLSGRSRRRQKGDLRFSRRRPAWERSPSFWPGRTWWFPGSRPVGKQSAVYTLVTSHLTVEAPPGIYLSTGLTL